MDDEAAPAAFAGSLLHASSPSRGGASCPTARHLVRLRRVRRAVEHEHRSTALSTDGPDVLLDEELLLPGRPLERHLRAE